MKSDDKYENLQRGDEQPQMVWRVRIGLTILVIGFASPLLIPVVAATDLPSGWKTALSGALALGIPEVFSILAIAIMGREGFDAIKSRFYSFIKRHGPPDRVSKTRYSIGLVMLLLPLIFAVLGPYFSHFIPVFDSYRLSFSIVGDLLVISSLLVLGGEFWDKVRALFIHDAVVQIRHS
jgi:hypothetical protein